MSFELPDIPAGNSRHPVPMILFAANNMKASTEFYAKLFGWQIQSMGPDLAAGGAISGPSVAFRSASPEGFPGTVPYILTSDIEAKLSQVVAAGGSVERAPFNVPMVGKLARFKDPSGTVYGLMGAMSPAPMPKIPMPFGSNPKPPAGTICSLEMYSTTSDAAAAFFGDLFGWGTLPTMGHYLGFDAGIGVGGVFQSHTPLLPAVAYIYSENVGAKMTEIENAGGSRIGEPMGMPGVATFGYFRDPSGTTAALIGP